MMKGGIGMSKVGSLVISSGTALLTNVAIGVNKVLVSISSALMPNGATFSTGTI